MATTQCPKCRNTIILGKPCPFCKAVEDAQAAEDEKLLQALGRLHARGQLMFLNPLGYLGNDGVVPRPTTFVAGEAGSEVVTIEPKGEKA